MELVVKNRAETHYLNHFRAADANHDGYITAVELQQRFKTLGKNVPLSYMQAYLRSKDRNGDQKLGYYGKN